MPAVSALLPNLPATRLQLSGSRSGPLEVAGRDLDLDLRLEQGRPTKVGVRRELLRRHPHGILERIPDGGGRQRHVPLGQPHQGQAGLWVPSGAVSGEQGLLGAVDVAPAQSDPSKFAQRPAQLPPQVGAQLLAGQQGFLLGLAAGPAQPEDLGAVDATAAVEAADGVGLTPSLHGLGPFLGQVVLGESLQGADELAVDDPGRQRIQLAGSRGHPGFVEEGQPLLDLAGEDEAARLCDPADGRGGRVATRTDVDRPPGPLPRAAHVTGQHPLVGCAPPPARRRRACRPEHRADAPPA